MAVYRKKLVDKDGNTIIPAIGDIYGPVYTASLQSASGGIATYTFAPDTPVENSRVYAVKFPTPTVNNATVILGDGTTSGSILVPPVAATDTPNYELLDTTMINETEPLLLMYNGVQWVCLNQKNKVDTADLNDDSVTSDKIDWTTLTQATSGTDSTAFKGYFDIGTIRIQYMQLRQTGLNTAAGGWNAWTVSWPVAFGDTLYAAVCAPTSDSGNVAGGELKVAGRTTTTVIFNYNHTGAIGNSEVYYAVIAIGKKP